MLARILPIAPTILFVLIWYIIAIGGNFMVELFPSPVDVFYALIEIVNNGELLNHSISSLLRVLSGFSIACLLGIPFGLLLGWYLSLWKAFYPLIQIFRTISPVAWIPLAILWFGIGDKPAIFIVSMSAFFPILISTCYAVRGVDPLLIKVAKNFGAKDSQIFRLIILPASLTSILVGMRITLGVCWMIIVAAEMVGMRSGLGYMILDARNFLRTDLVIAGMIVIGLIGLSLDRAMTYLESKVRINYSA
jgi:NitT/TauT family transport system permease protein